MYDYGNEPWCLVGILNIDTSTNTSLVSNADCTALPTDLNLLVGGAHTTVTTNLESVNIPGTWVTSANSWRDVVLFVGAACQYAQRFQGLVGGRWFTGAITLDSTYGSLPVGARNGILTAALSFGFVTTGITGSSTLRQIITSAAQQYISLGLPLLLAGVDLYTD
jgi:hypothetical protein